MGLFTYTAKVTNTRTGTTRTKTGTVEAPGGSKQRAEAAATDQASSGDRDERIDVDVRYAS